MKRVTSIFLILFALAACSEKPQEKGPEPDIKVGIIEHLGDTIPQGIWYLDEDNDTVKLDEIIDKPTIFSFVYFDCPGICSPLMSSIEILIDKLDMELGKDYQVLTISFNTNDTPIKAKKKKKDFSTKFKDEDQKHWKFLTGTQENVDAMTNALGFKYTPRGFDFDHPGAIIMVSPNGKITRYFMEYEKFNQFDVKLAIIEAGDELEQPTRNKILKYCFTYDEEKKGYRVDVTSVTATLMLIVAVPFLFFLIIRNRRTKIDKKE